MMDKWNMIGLESLDCSERTDGPDADPEQSALKEICITNGINLKKLPNEGPKVTSLELFFNGFVELHCMKKFPNITKLVLFGSDLSALFRVDFGSLLTELWLCEANLKRIPDLTGCPHIEMLYLYGNKLTKIDNLQHLKNLQILDLAENLLEDMAGLSSLSELSKLNLAANRIRKIGPELEKLKKLSKLDLSGNPIESLIELNPLRNLFNLTELNIAQNIYPLAPICRLQNYQLQIFYTLQSLTSLDGEEVSKRIVTEAIKVIKRKIIYYNMKNTILKRSLPEYLDAVRNLSESRLNVPMESIKDLKSELFRVKKCQKNKETIGAIEKAAINHKLDLLEVRLNYWKEFHRKLQREQRKAFQALLNSYKLSELMIKLELQSGGNIRFEETEKDAEKEPSEAPIDTMNEELETINYWCEISKLVDKNCAPNRRTVLGIEEIQINRITRIFHRPKRMKFDEEMDDILYQTNYNINQSYVFLQSDPTKPDETVRFVDKCRRNSTNSNILCTSPFDADTRFNKNYNSSYPPASCHLIICRVYLGRSLPVKGDQWDIKSYPSADSIYEETLNGRKYSLLSEHHLLPEYIIEMEYIPKPRSFPPLIFHDCVDNQRHQFTPRPTQAQEDKDYEVKNCHPRTTPADISTILNGEISNLTVLALVGQDLEEIPNLITVPHLKELNVSCNRLTAVERVIRCSRQLQIFDCSHNCITSFDLPEFKQLHTLQLSWNNLSRISQLITMFNAKTVSLTNLDLRSNFFKEDNDETHSKITVFDHCVAKIGSLKVCNGTNIVESTRQQLMEQMILTKKIIRAKGRNGNAHGSIKLCNTSQYLMSFEKVSDMSKISSICLDEMGLHSIGELKNIVTLRYLSINGNHITDLSPLKSCLKLVELSASDNKLVKVTQVVNSLPALQILDLSQNDIFELPLDKGLIYLTTLNLSGNRISQVSSYTKLKRLKELYLSNNLIGDCNELIHLKNCPALEILDITSNPFKDKLENAPKLFIMYHFNNLKALDGYPVDSKDVKRAKDIFGGRLTNDFLVEKFGYSDGVAHVNLNAIDELDLRDCDIRSVHLEPDKLTNLTSLNMMGNLLSNFSGLIYLKEVKTLCLSNNNIESVFPLTKNQRAQMNRSQYSQYQKRDFGDKKLTAKASEDSELLPKLEVLHLGNNKIKDMCLLQLRRFPKLKSLFLEGNDITKIDGLEGCSNIRHLVLDRNRIKQIDPNSFQGQWRLEELHLDSNRLMYMSNIRPLVNLKRLYLGMNRIQEVDEIAKLRPLTSLMDVSVIGNGLARRMLHRPMLIWHVPSIENIDGMKVSIEERQNAEAYFMDQGQEPVFHMFDSYNPREYPRNEHQNGTTTPSLSAVLSHGYKSYPYQNGPIKGTVTRLQNQNQSSNGNGPKGRKGNH